MFIRWENSCSYSEEFKRAAWESVNPRWITGDMFNAFWLWIEGA